MGKIILKNFDFHVDKMKKSNIINYVNKYFYVPKTASGCILKYLAEEQLS